MAHMELPPHVELPPDLPVSEPSRSVFQNRSFVLLWVAQVLTPEDEGFGPLDFDTSRPEFIGRTGSLERPHALSGFEGRGQRGEG